MPGSSRAVFPIVARVRPRTSKGITDLLSLTFVRYTFSCAGPSKKCRTTTFALRNGAPHSEVTRTRTCGRADAPTTRTERNPKDDASLAGIERGEPPLRRQPPETL